MNKQNLNDYCQVMKIPYPVYTLESKTGSAHDPLYCYKCVLCNLTTISSEKHTRKEAENEAARLMLEEITFINNSQCCQEDYYDKNYYLVDSESWYNENYSFPVHKIFVNEKHFITPNPKIFKTNHTAISLMLYALKLAPIAETENSYVYIVGTNPIFLDCLSQLGSCVKIYKENSE